MRILHWNILHGGGPQRSPEIALALLQARADVVVLSEFRRTTGGQIAGVLHDHGLPHQAHTNPPLGANGLLIASRTPLSRSPTPPDPDLAQRCLDARLETEGFWLTAVHLPDAARGDHHATARKARHWRALLDLARPRAAAGHVIVGDFNTGRHHLDEAGQTFTCTALLGQLATFGYVDAYRAADPKGRESSWFSRTGQGFRLDHAFVSAPLAGSIRAADYAHELRLAGLSDHAPMRLELAPGAPGGAGEVRIA